MAIEFGEIMTIILNYLSSKSWHHLIYSTYKLLQREDSSHHRFVFQKGI